jgi:hypothetical protein
VATIPQYVNTLLRRQIALSDDLGANVTGAGRELYCINAELLVVISVVLKVLKDKGFVTDAEWTSALNAALDDPFPAWIKDQIPPP